MVSKEMIPLKRGCFCCSVRTCVLIQGWMHSVTATLVVLLTLGMIPFLDAIYNSGAPTEERREIWSLGTAVLYIIFLLGFFYAAIQYIMLAGIYKKRAWMLVPHLVLTAFVTLGVSIFVLVNLQTGVATVIFIAFFVCTQTYFWFHVLSYYLELNHGGFADAPLNLETRACLRV